jgi:ABC-type transport system substrate-binding protein
MERSWMGSGLVHPELYESLFSECRTTNDWGRSPFPEHFIASGIYRFSGYITDQYLEIEKRGPGSSPIEDMFTADRISFYIAPTEDVQWMLFDSGQLDQTTANARRFDEFPDLYYYANGFVYGIFLNPWSETNPILQDIDFRTALYWGLDRERIVRAAYPIAAPQAFLFPQTTRMRAEDFRETGIRLSYRESDIAANVRVRGYELEDQFGFVPDRALHYFNLAYERNGGVPISIEVQYSDGGEAPQIWAEAIQESWQNLFGADRFQVNLVAVPTQTALDNLQRHAMNYEIIAARRIWQVLDERAWRNTNWITTGHPFSYPTQYCVLTNWAQIMFTGMFDMAYADFLNQALCNEMNGIIEQIILSDHTFLPMYNHRDRLLFSPWLESIMEEGHFAFRAAPFQFIWDDAMYEAMNR